MNNNKENLEGIVAKLKQQGINAGEEEKHKIISDAKKQSEILLLEAETLRKSILEEAQIKAEQMQKNAQTAIAQASRDMVEATKITILNHLKQVFGKQCAELFTQEQYLQELLKVVIMASSGKQEISIPAEMMVKMEAYLQTQAFGNDVVLTPLQNADAKIVAKTDGNNGVQFVLSSEDVETALFSLLNKDLVEQITKSKEA